jgi:hypothetical protein
MARVVCTLVAKGWIGGVLYSQVALDLVTFWRIRVKVDICRLESYIYRVARDPQLGIIDSNRRCSSVMETRSPDLHHSNKWKYGRRLRKKLYGLLELGYDHLDAIND